MTQGSSYPGQGSIISKSTDEANEEQHQNNNCARGGTFQIAYRGQVDVFIYAIKTQSVHPRALI
jgi:hypothetical protein